MTIKCNLQTNYHKTIFTLIFSLCLILFFSFGVNVFGQGSKIVNNNYNKPKPNPTPTKTKNNTKKTTTKKTTPAKPKVNKSTPKKTTRKTRKISRGRNLIAIKIFTPIAQQEILLGEEILGVSDENKEFTTKLKKGNYLLSLKNQDSEDILSSQLVSITKDNKEFTLEVDVPEEPKEPEITAEQILEDKLKVALDAAERINEILKNYGDPMKTNTLTVSDWEFVYQSAQANNLKNFTAIQIEAQRWFSSGQIDLAKGNYANAYGNFTKAIEFMPDSAYPYYALGDAYTANKQYPDAFAAYEKAVQINSKFALAHRKLGEIHLKSNRVKDAIVSFEQAIKNGFDTPSIRYELGKAYLGNEDWDKASKELEYVVKETPTGDVYITLGKLYTKLKRNISAYESYKKATEFSPNSANAYYQLAQILYDEKEYESAKIALEQALTLDEKGKEINIPNVKKMIRDAAQKLK